MSVLKNFLKLAAAIAISELAGIVGATFTTPAIGGWYADLRKPLLSPPKWLFAPVWIALYALMGIAAFLVWKKGLDFPGVKKALALFLAQLVLNASWTIIFFGAGSPAWAFAEIVVLWLAIFWTAAEFRKLSRAAFYFLLPYLLWVSFAAYLNLSIWALNV